MPPIGVTVIDPLVSPLQTGCPIRALSRSSANGSVSSVEITVLQSLKSVTVVKYVPAARLKLLSFCEPSSHEKE